MHPVLRSRSFLLLACAAAWGMRRCRRGPPRRPRRSKVAGLRCEYKTDPLGIDATAPRLSWQLRSDARGTVQSAYQVQVAKDAGALAAGRTLWDSGRVSSAQSVHVPYAGPALESSRRYHWRVRAWDGKGTATPWSAGAWFETGLLSPADWKARWIEPIAERGPEEVAAGADAARDVRGPRHGALGARVRDEPRPLRARDQRPPRGRSALHAGLDELRQAPPVPDLRRHRAAAHRRQRDRRDCSATAGTAATSRGATGATSTATAWPCCASCGSSTPTAGSRRSAATRSGRRRPARSSPPTSTWARPTTRASRSPAGARPASPTPTGRRCAWWPRRRSTCSSRRPARRCARSRS